MIITVFDSQPKLMQAICQLYRIEYDSFDLDPTYGKGMIHKGIAQPRRAFDLVPAFPWVSAFDVRDLPFIDGEVSSIVFDPPFLAGGGATGIMHGRYSSFKTVDELLAFYQAAGAELARVLAPKGVLVVKCQDLNNGRTQTFSHCEIYQLFLDLGLYARDLFILTNPRTMRPHNMVNQNHARKAHSYFWVFEKCGRKNKRLTKV